MATDRRNAQLLEDAQKEFRKYEAPALRALEYQKSEQYRDDMTGFLEEIQSIVGVAKMNDHEALIAIGRIHHIIETWKKPQAVIERFNSAKQSLTNILAA